MNDDLPVSTAAVAGRPLYLKVVPVPVACFIGALLTDIAYWRSADMMWTNFSAWLLAAGMATGVLAALAGLIDLAASRHVRARRPTWPHVVGGLVVLVVAFFDNLVHTRDAWTSVVPTGLILSALVVVLTLITAWLGSSVAHRYGMGVGVAAR